MSERFQLEVFAIARSRTRSRSSRPTPYRARKSGSFSTRSTTSRTRSTARSAIAGLAHVRLRQLRVQDRRRAEARLQGVPARLQGQDPVEPLDNFPIERDLVVIDDFIEKRRASSRASFEGAEAGYPRASICRRRRSSRPTSSTRCASTACCATRPARNTRLPTGVHRPGGAGVGAPLQQRLRDIGRGARQDVAARTKASGSAASSAPARSSARRMSIRPGRSSR